MYIGHAAIDRATNEPNLDAAVGAYFTYNLALFTTASLPHAQRRRPRLRVGYLTADVHDHPTALLIHGMFGPQTDSGRIQVYLYSYGPDDGSLYRAAIARECEHFKHREHVPYAAIAREINEDGVHIIIDMKQHTESHALHVIALRPAPLQIAWLGFPGGVGGGLASHIVGDAIVTPPEHAAYFDESLALMPMPVSYQVNNYKHDPFMGEHTRPFAPPDAAFDGGGGGGGGNDGDDAEQQPLQAARGGVTYTMLNHARKLKPVRFGSYMQILARVSNSSLSVLSRHGATGDNLRRESAARGVAGERIQMAPVLGKRQHVQRMREASLFLDTFPYGAHTTSSESMLMYVYIHMCICIYITRPPPSLYLCMYMYICIYMCIYI